MADSINRTLREQEARETEQRTATWKPAALLPEPNPVKGWKFKYIRVSSMGFQDPTNASAMFREGWVPVKAEDHPELLHMVDPGSTSRFKDGVEIGGLLLCKAPAEVVQQRTDHYNRLARSQMEAVDNTFMRQNDPRMPMERNGAAIERKSTTTFGRGNKP